MKKDKKIEKILLVELYAAQVAYTDSDGMSVVESGPKRIFKVIKEDQVDRLEEGANLYEVVKRFKIKKETKLEEIK